MKQPILALLVGLSTITLLVGCGNKETPATDPNASAASTAAAQAVPMSAAPADDKNGAIVINENNATVDAGPEVANGAANEGLAASQPMVADGSIPAAIEGGADNSAMEKISENDQVVDNEPASPNAPRASDEGKVQNKAVGNAKVSP